MVFLNVPLHSSNNPSFWMEKYFYISFFVKIVPISPTSFLILKDTLVYEQVWTQYVTKYQVNTLLHCSTVRRWYASRRKVQFISASLKTINLEVNSDFKIPIHMQWNSLKTARLNSLELGSSLTKIVPRWSFGGCINSKTRERKK